MTGTGDKRVHTITQTIDRDGDTWYRTTTSGWALVEGTHYDGLPTDVLRSRYGPLNPDPDTALTPVAEATDQQSETTSAPELPTGITCVRDRDGDLWYRLTDGTWTTDPDEGGGESLAYVASAWGPLTPVIDTPVEPGPVRDTQIPTMSRAEALDTATQHVINLARGTIGGTLAERVRAVERMADLLMYGGVAGSGQQDS